MQGQSTEAQSTELAQATDSRLRSRCCGSDGEGASHPSPRHLSPTGVQCSGMRALLERPAMALVGRGLVCVRSVMRAPPRRLAARCTPRGPMPSRMGGWCARRSGWSGAVTDTALTTPLAPTREVRGQGVGVVEGLARLRRWAASSGHARGVRGGAGYRAAGGADEEGAVAGVEQRPPPLPA